ncbi:MAG: dTDP-4-dehydrorhamnose 3,5-epimerase [Ignavibacteria bacterium GWF2_33_9]|nr:MAG: dTDP-4-dehydrorhamnose 3,5-epimerase [Ignavibacteria bacterium GWF2_33_9]
MKLLEPNLYRDDRGIFIESVKLGDLQEIGITDNFVQENISISKQNVIRGLHFQIDPPQGKLITVLHGKAKFVEVDVRPNSKTFGKHVEFYLNDKNYYYLWVPPGFANGFAAFTDKLIVNYKVTNYWNPRSEGILLYNDKILKIDWEIDNPILSDRDKMGIPFKDISF